MRQALLLGFLLVQAWIAWISITQPQFARFEQALSDGKRIFSWISSPPKEEAVSEKALKSHPQVELAETGSGIPD